tara:strand:+ start:43 stop:579 length:537 start_codon:yes stop_codon:yes gene_type:complete
MNFIKRFFGCSKLNNSGVYRLLLKDDKIYIGKSNNIENRINSHMNNDGSAWTKKYNYVKRLPTITNKSDSLFWELEETLENIYLFGIDNVRGSMFCQITLSRADKIKAAQLYCEMYDLCKRCGSDNHYITSCTQNQVEPWVHKFGGELDLYSRKCKRCFKDISHKPDYHKYCEGCFAL